ncbi:hypothetical protein L2E82_23001 [Cichorium intybus]|uniref:Uncharacterized protein n=1 Tax=Cichorium intybus TaxID=13427 RepID=A0ACB9E017_CICIN|nr:hypothetical protein L2E82_23001 [Cichorium intybus]
MSINRLAERDEQHECYCEGSDCGSGGIKPEGTRLDNSVFRLAGSCGCEEAVHRVNNSVDGGVVLEA